MNVVVDTNVFISGFVWKGYPGKIVEAWLDGKIHLVASTDILEEYSLVADRITSKYGVKLNHFIELLATNCTVVAVSGKKKQISKDPDDDKFIYSALESKTKIIISGDKHLLELDGYMGLEILTPKAYVDNILI